MEVNLSKKQKSTIELIKKIETHFGVRWFIKAELIGVTQHTMDALVSKNILEYQDFDGVLYFRYKG